jgi:site-specific recombinase XerC
VGKTYKSKAAARMHAREIKSRANPRAQRVGEGKHAHPHPRGGQENKRKR